MTNVRQEIRANSINDKNTMSEKIKPSEVSEVLTKQLQGINDSQQFDEVGTVLTVADGGACLRTAQR